LKVAVSGQGRDHWHLGLWRSDCCECDTKMGDSSSPTADVARAWEVFEMSQASQECGIKLAATWACKTTHQFEGSWSHHKIWLEIFTPSVLHPHCHPHVSICLELWRMCAVEFETNENVICSWELGCMSRTRRTHTCTLLAQGHRSWPRLYGGEIQTIAPHYVWLIILAERKKSGH
jgi:hypothetical protein